MKTLPGKWMLTLVALIAVVFIVWGVARTAPQAMSSQQGMSSQQMQMMKKMMMNAPKDSKEAQRYIKEQKQKAMAAGKYNCCLKNSCNWCAVHMGQCTCYHNAANNMPVCNECKGGWYAGNGRVPGKTADQIETMPRPLP